MGTLYYGDDLDILRRFIADESIDLVYLDLPFNSAQNYRGFFEERTAIPPSATFTRSSSETDNKRKGRKW